MSDFLQLAESQETAASLNRMNRSKDARKKVLRRGIRFQFDEFAVEPVQILVTFDQEFLDQIVHCTTLLGKVVSGEQNIGMAPLDTFTQVFRLLRGTFHPSCYELASRYMQLIVQFADFL